MKKISLFAVALIASASLMAQKSTTPKKDKASKAAKLEAPKQETAEVVSDEKVATLSATPLVQPVVKDITKVLNFSETVHPFGKIPQNKPVEFDVTVKNISSDSITIQRVDVQCGCTTPKYAANTKYGPGQSFKVTLGFNAAALGNFNKTATLVFSDGLVQTVSFNGETYAVATDAAPANEATEKLKPSGK